MKLLVLSDSHSALSFMRSCVKAVRPDGIIHLGDYYEDGTVLAEENPQLPIHQVPGNCDLYRSVANTPVTLCYPVGGVMLYMTHGHKQHVKSGIGGLVADARRCGAQAALYGHTHVADCHQEPDGLWVLNPGSCGYHGGTAGLLEIENETIVACRIITQADLEEMA